MEPIDEKDFDRPGGCASCSPRLATSISRRAFIRRAALLSASGIVLLSPHAWAARSLDTSSKRRLVVVFLRGAVDGLNVVVPFGEPAYYDARPTIAIAAPAARAASIDLDGFFGLHPRLAPFSRCARRHARLRPRLRLARSDALAFRRAGLHGERHARRARRRATAGSTALLAQHCRSRIRRPRGQPRPELPRILGGPRCGRQHRARPRARAAPMPIDRPDHRAGVRPHYAGNDAISRAYREGRDVAQDALMSRTRE